MEVEDITIARPAIALVRLIEATEQRCLFPNGISHAGRTHILNRFVVRNRVRVEEPKRLYHRGVHRSEYALSVSMVQCI